MSEDTNSVQHQKDLEYIANFTLMDDDFMKKVFEDVRCAQTALRVIMDLPSLKITSVRTEYVVHNLYGHSVRLDVYGRDDKGKEYDVEVQRDDKGADPRRARFNSSLMDANTLGRGEDYTKLPESYVIFITGNDVLRGGRPIYHIKRTIDETGIEFGDGAHIIYVNSEIQDNTPLGRLMHDFYCKNSQDMYYKDIADRVSYFKEDKEGVRSMCKAMEEMRAEAAAEAEQRKAVIDIKNVMESLKIGVEQAMSILRISGEDADKYKRLVMG